MNGGIRCIQGMNKILTPLFFVFQSDLDDKINVWSKRLFVPKVLSALHSTADSPCIRGTLAKLSQLVAKFDGELQHR